jgi:hypothetical protein
MWEFLTSAASFIVGYFVGLVTFRVLHFPKPSVMVAADWLNITFSAD